MMRLRRSVTWQWLTAAVVGGGLLAGGVTYGFASQPARGALAQEAPAATPTPAVASPPAAPHAKPQAKPQNTNSRRPTGEVVAISQEPASLTMRTAAGEDLTFRVLQTTVFAAGRDRPYRFELLKVGDQVTVVAGGMGQGAGANAANGGAPKPAAKPSGAAAKPSAATAKPSGAAARGQGPRAAARAAQASGELLARQVMVRPAGEAPRAGAGKKSGGRKPAGQQPQVQPQSAAGQPQNDGGSDAAGQ